MHQSTYTLTTKTTPFFDKRQGFIYNIQSLAMIMSPVCMALGAYLSISAHNELLRQTTPLLEGNVADFGAVLAAGDEPRPADGHADPGVAGPGGGAGGRHERSGRDTLERFQGQSHKLS